MRINYNDKGLKSVADALIQSFVQNKIVQDQDLQISNISLPVFDKIWGNIYISDTGETAYFIIGHIVTENSDISVQIGNLAVSLKIRDKESSKMLRKLILSELLSKHIKGPDGTKTTTGIVCNKNRERRGELSAYTFIEDNVIVDEFVVKDFNDTLNEEDIFRSVFVLANKPSSFILDGYVQTPDNFNSLKDYVNTNFPYLVLYLSLLIYYLQKMLLCLRYDRLLLLQKL